MHKIQKLRDFATGINLLPEGSLLNGDCQFNRQAISPKADHGMILSNMSWVTGVGC